MPECGVLHWTTGALSAAVPLSVLIVFRNITTEQLVHELSPESDALLLTSNLYSTCIVERMPCWGITMLLGGYFFESKTLSMLVLLIGVQLPPL